MRRLISALALAAGLLSPAAPAVAAGAEAPAPTADSGGIGIRLLDAPTSAAADPRARSYIVDHLARGAVIHRRVEVGNTTSSTASVALSTGAAEVAGGAFAPATDRPGDELRAWTSTNPTSVSLRPGEHAPVDVTIRIPDDASPGERYGVVWAAHSTAAPKAGGVTLVNRVGVRLYVSVGPGGAPASKFEVSDLVARRAADGSPSVVAQVHNTGGRALDVGGGLDLSDGPGGLRAGPFPLEGAVTLAPGETEPVVVLLDKQVPDGPWNAALVLRSGTLEQRTTATLTFPRTEGSLAATASAGSGLPAVAGIAAVVLLGGGGLLFARRRPAARTAGPGPATGA